MTDQSGRNSSAQYVSPSIDRRNFHCPNCAVYAHQLWHRVRAAEMPQQLTPVIRTPQELANWLHQKEDGQARYLSALGVIEPPDPTGELKAKNKALLNNCLQLLTSGKPAHVFSERIASVGHQLENIWLSKCSHCSEFAIWISQELVWPVIGTAPVPHADMPKHVRAEYEEASSIFEKSPRGAAALLRISVELLCKQVGATGSDLNESIATLVRKGLPKKIQQALDSVRVVGNNAVHPGQMDLRDDRETAEVLFGLVNFIVEKMISEPKKISRMYDKLPEGALKAIKERDAGAKD